MTSPFGFRLQSLIIISFVKLLRGEWISSASQNDVKSKGKYNGPHPELAAKLEKEILDTNPGVKWNDVAGLRKTLLAKAVAIECGTTFMNISCSSFCGKWSATEHETSRRVKSELLVQIDGLNNSNNTSGKPVTLLAATNFPGSLDEALRGRLEKRIYIPLPDFKSRKELIEINLKSIALAPVLDIEQVARRTEGYSGDDLTNICRDASLNGMRRMIAGKTTDEIKNISKTDILKIPVTMDDFLNALDKIQPTVSAGDTQRHEK
ncbi:hypothetical protein RND71_001714 [Anisodus tanguticus]|uniref:Uncharacterized protein n=1 Tax=Anisodus tanguticus TaxID=243964 RepID=A0AAE1VSH1_9SOLA|nr:hypothetical protein RND71_001714 [Anisodus tanguticus]